MIVASIETSEAVWTALAAAAVFVNFFGLVDARHSLAALCDSEDEIEAPAFRRMRVVARGNVRREWGRVVVSATFLAVGLLSFTRAPTVSSETGRQDVAVRWLMVAGLVFAVGWLVIDSLLDRRDRRRLLRYSTPTKGEIR